MVQSRFMGIPEDIDFGDEAAAGEPDDCQCEACKDKRKEVVEGEPEMTPSMWQKVVKVLWGGY